MQSEEKDPVIDILEAAILFVDKLTYPDANRRDFQMYNKGVLDAVNRLKKLKNYEIIKRTPENANRD